MDAATAPANTEGHETQAKPRKTLKDHLQAFLGALLIVGLTLLAIEVLLRVVDPWGMSYFDDLAYMGDELFSVHPQRGYYIPDGTYQLSHWSATFADGARVLPDNNTQATCEVVILGDSVAFGYGVDDADAWANLIAQALANVRLVNTALPRYNSTNVLGSLQAFPDGDAYLYLIIENDIENAINPATHTFAGQGVGIPQIVRYANFFVFRGTSTPIWESGGSGYPTEGIHRDSPLIQRFFGELDQILQDERVELAAFAGYAITNTLLARDYDVQVLDYPPHPISFADDHLNEIGNRELATQMLPIFQGLQAGACA